MRNLAMKALLLISLTVVAGCPSMQPVPVAEPEPLEPTPAYMMETPPDLLPVLNELIYVSPSE
jgi:hypothetical protein